MISFKESIRAYEQSLRALFGPLFREADLKRKHERMREEVFLFLRGTCWRWAEGAPELCPELMDGPVVDSVGDAHAGNFGLWLDGEGRLVWGINDFDEAAAAPYGLELVRLCASLLLADGGLAAERTADLVLEGYRRGLAAPAAMVLEREHLWLRDAFSATAEKREEFWRELAEADEEDAPGAYRSALTAALPAGASAVRITARVAGVGSLGRPRFAAVAAWNGGPVGREAKGRAPSSWGGQDPDLPQRLARGRWRSPDPVLDYRETLVMRRLAPNDRKLRFDEIKRSRSADLLTAMGAELAAIHAAQEGAAAAILADLEARPGDWLAKAAAAVANWTTGEWKAYRR